LYRIKKLNNVKYNISSVIFFIVLSFSFLLPVNQKASTITLLSLTLFCSLKYKAFNINIFKKFIPFYILYIIYGIAFFRDKYEFTNLMFERKALLLALPIIFSIISLSKYRLNQILKYFVYGCAFAYIISILIAFNNAIDLTSFSFNSTIESYRVNVLENPEASILLTNYFLGINFALDMNVTVLSIYFSFAIALLHIKKELFSIKERYIITILLSLGVFQLFSALGVLMLFYVLILIIKPKTIKLLMFIGFSIFLISLYAISKKEDFEIQQKEKLEKLDNRVFIWYTSLNTIASSNFIFGTGVKKAQKLLDRNYPKEGEFGFNAQIKKLDSHNMYLQFILEVGLIGLAMYLISIFQFFKGIKFLTNKNKQIATLFISLVLFSNITECAFNLYIGLSFFAFFYTLFVTYSHYENQAI